MKKRNVSSLCWIRTRRYCRVAYFKYKLGRCTYNYVNYNYCIWLSNPIRGTPEALMHNEIADYIYVSGLIPTLPVAKGNISREL